VSKIAQSLPRSALSYLFRYLETDQARAYWGVCSRSAFRASCAQFGYNAKPRILLFCNCYPQFLPRQNTSQNNKPQHALRSSGKSAYSCGLSPDSESGGDQRCPTRLYNPGYSFHVVVLPRGRSSGA